MLFSLITVWEIVINFSKVKKKFETGYSTDSDRRQKNMHEGVWVFQIVQLPIGRALLHGENSLNSFRHWFLI